MALESSSPYGVGDTTLSKPKPLFSQSSEAVEKFTYPYNNSTGNFPPVFNNTTFTNASSVKSENSNAKSNLEQNTENDTKVNDISNEDEEMEENDNAEIEEDDIAEVVSESISNDTSKSAEKEEDKAAVEKEKVDASDDKKVVENHVEETNDDSEMFSDNEDLVECGNCDAEFQCLQDYMDHTCNKNREDNNNIVSESVMKKAIAMDEKESSDVESFDGKIVYNPDGSAYIIEGDSDSDIDSMLHLPQKEGLIIDKRGKNNESCPQAIPQIDNAFFVPRNPSTLMNNIFTSPSTQQTPIMHSYKVYDLRSGKHKVHSSGDPAIEDLSNSNTTMSVSESSTSIASTSTSSSTAHTRIGHAGTEVPSVPTKPILMCFICKLSFGFAKSFTTHASNEHSMEMTNDEQDIMSRKNSSAIIQGIGKDKDPLMSFLEPIKSAGSGESKTKMSSMDTSSMGRSNNSMKETTNVSYVYTKPKTSEMYNDSVASSSKQLGPKDMSIHDMKEQIGKFDGNVPSNAVLSHISQKIMNYEKPDSNDAKKLKLDINDSDSQSSFQMNSLPSYMDTEMSMAPSTKSYMTQYAPPQRAGFYGVCEEHPNGRVQGVECPSCDMVLSSSQSLGGHMTMMHSRNSCKTLKCPKCNWHYKYQETLEIHMKEKHPEGDQKCMYCLTNQSHPRLARGESYSCGYKPYRCEVCNYSTTTKGNLSIHMQSDKHLNNVQDLANGGGELKMPVHPSHTQPQMTRPQTPQHPSLSQNPSKTPPHQQMVQHQQQQQLQQQRLEQQQQQQKQLHQSHAPQAPPQSAQMPHPSPADMKKNKPKPTWRCDVCNYETNVARNLRIHMTSEKHTHNMMVLQQNMKHMQRDMQIHQMNQLVMLQQDPSFMGLTGPIPGGITYPYDASLMMGGMPAGFGDAPMDLSKENGVGPGGGGGGEDGREVMDVSRLFQCCVCNIYGSDSLEALHQHLQHDRTKQHESENITIASGTYMCHLCSYKTNLKANFQLHCKTDKHIQRLQLVNHIKEGGNNNEWRLKYLNVSNPVQVRCNACDYYTNSIHKLQIHTGNPRHEASAQLFCHLQIQESKLPKAEDKYYRCTLCAFNARTKLGLMQHVHSLQHLHSESVKQIEMKERGQLEIDIGEIFTVREIQEKGSVTFDDEDGVGTEEGSTVADQETNSFRVGTPLSPSQSHNNNNNNTIKPTADDSITDKGDAPSLKDPSAPQHVNNNQAPNNVSGEMHLKAHVNSTHHHHHHQQQQQQHGHLQQHPLAHLPPHHRADFTKALASLPPIACPLCQDPCVPKEGIEVHLKTVHNVNSEGLQKLLSLVPEPSTGRDGSKMPPTASLKETMKAMPKPNSKSLEVVHVDIDALDDEYALLAAEDAVDLAISAEKEAEEQFRCQTCSKTFANIDQLYSHQNELGHLELKQTPRGPGYLCWKKGCNQYFKTAQALQMHFREIHAKRMGAGSLDRSEYKHQCQMCTLAFKSLQKLNFHGQLHIIKTAVSCKVCSKSFSTLLLLRNHMTDAHTLNPEEQDLFKTEFYSNVMALSAFANDPKLSKVFSLTEDVPKENHKPAKLSQNSEQDSDAVMKEREIEENGDYDSDCSSEEGSSGSPHSLENGLERAHLMESLEKRGEEDLNSKEQQFFEDYINSQAFAEGSYEDPNRKFKCHRCRVAFTKQNYLSAHNKTILHRKGEKMSYPMEKFMDPNRPYKCDICKESFTQKNILLVHYNSVSHLHKVKQAGLPEGLFPTLPTAASPTSAPSPSPVSNTPSSTSSTATERTSSSKPSRDLSPEDDSMRPYKCHICKVSYSQGSTLDIHIRSVAHQTRASKLQELAKNGEVDLTRPLIEEPMDKSFQAQQQLINEILTKQTSLAMSTQPSLLFPGMSGYPGFPGIPSLPGLPLLAGLPPLMPLSLPNQVFPSSLASSTSSHKQSSSAERASVSSPAVTSESSMSSSKSLEKISQQLMASQSQKTSEPSSITSTSTVQAQTQPSGSIKVCGQCSAVFASQDSYLQHQMMCSGSSSSPGPQSGQQASTRPRFIGRIKPAVQRNLLENFGFECVMQFNEFNQRAVKREEEVKEKETSSPDGKSDNNPSTSNGNPESEVKMEEVKEEPKEAEKNEKDESEEVESKDSEKKEEDDEKKEKEMEVDEAAEEKAVVDLPEMNKCLCSQCGKQFSSVWVLKAHQEEVHKEIVPIEMVEDFGENFKCELEKQVPVEAPPPPPVEVPVVVAPTPPAPPPAPVVEEKVVKQEMPPPPPPPQTQIPVDMLQMMNMFGMGMMPVPMPLMMNGQPGMMPMSMMMPPPGMDPGMKSPGLPGMDSAVMNSQHKSQMQSAAAMNNQKRARTRINDEQLKVLRGYFDINNSPSEEQIQAMSEQTGLPMKVIKHWFRNTLFKERQRNKDSPYNFNNPPSTTLDLEEYEKTGKLTIIEDSPPVSENPSPALKAEVPEVKKEVIEKVEMPEIRPDTHIRHTPKEMPEIRSNNPHPLPLKKEISNPHSSCGGLKSPSSDKLERHQLPMTPSQSPAPTQHMNPHSEPASTPAPAHSSGSSSSLPSTPSSKFTPPGSSGESMMPGLISNMPGMPPGGPPSYPPVSTTPTSMYDNTYSPPSGSSGRRANRTRFTDYQIKCLQEYFEQNAYPKDDELEHLSKVLGLSPRVIVVWFQNARQKARKIYENQPAEKDTSSSSSTATSPFNRTPGLNYQCKKCQAVFQRYYDLIRHQKRHCGQDGDRPDSQMMSDDSDSMSHATSLDNVYYSDSESEHSVAGRSLKESMSSRSEGRGSESRSESRSEAMTRYQCDKCDMSFHNVELYKDHQNLHTMNPGLFLNMPTSSAFGVLQSMAAAQQSMDDRSPSKRKFEEEIDDQDQPRDKRLRTTILPEQLDYLYQKYQMDCNPSRKQLEAISKDVGLKKRVVQVWFQNTRARERKGQYRAHQQLIHKRCPICRALFRAKSALESHLATKHPDEMAKGEINIDAIPDAAIESPGPSTSNLMPPSPDYNKILAPPGMQGLLPYMPPSSLPMGFPPMADPIHMSMKQFYEDSFKKYINELSSTSHTSHKGAPPSLPELTSTPIKTETAMSMSSSAMDDDAPLDLSKPLKVSTPSDHDKHRDGPISQSSHSSAHSSSEHSDHRRHPSGHGSSHGVLTSSVDQSYLMRRFNHDSSMMEHHDKSEEEVSNISSSPASPGQQLAGMGGVGNKRYRTQMTSLQVRIMKHIFIDYKTPTMAECEMLGRVIGLQKRVVQVWFQNARAKEKKAKLNMAKNFSNPDLDFPKPPEECTLCNFKYSHKYTIQDHIFTRKHIDKVREYIQSQSDAERELSSSAASMAGVSGLLRSQQANEVDHMRSLMKEANSTESQMAQLQSMGLGPLGMPPGSLPGMGFSNPGEYLKDLKKDTSSSSSKEKKDGDKHESSSTKKESKAPSSSSLSAAQAAEAAQLQSLGMLSPFGGLLPGVDPTMLPGFYPGLPGLLPGMGGLPMPQPGFMPPGAEHLFGYDPMTYGTPLPLLQIPQQAIKDVSSKLMEPSASVGQYTQDCKSISSLRSLVSNTDYSCVRESTVDVGYICKKCQMVYPAREACVSHQRMMCFAGGKIPEGISAILKLEQIQYECRLCSEKMSTVQEFKSHCQTEGHKSKVAGYIQQKSSPASVSPAPPRSMSRSGGESGEKKTDGENRV